MEKLMSDHGLFPSYEGRQGAANGQDSWGFFRDTQGFGPLDAGSRAGFTSSRPPPPWTSVSFRGSNWLIEKRYNDFAALHRGLSREFRDKDVGQLPPKRFFNRFDPQFLEERSQALQSFLMRVLVEIPVTSSEAMMEFLEVSKHVHMNQPEEQDHDEEEDRRAEFEALEEQRLKELVQNFVERMVYSQSVKVEPRDDAEVEERRQRLLIACDGFRAHDEHLKQFFNKPPPVNNFMQSGAEAAIELETPPRLSAKAVNDLMTVNDTLFDEQKKGRPIMSNPDLVTHLDTL